MPLKKNTFFLVAESTVGQLVKVSKNGNGKLTKDHVWAVMDGRWHVNPGTIKAQVEGAIVMAPGAATIHEITFNDGMAGQNNFYSYKILGMTDVPPIDILWKPDSDAGGGGEPALPAFASALVNAIYDLTGKRVRKLPFGLDTVWSTVSEE